MELSQALCVGEIRECPPEISEHFHCLQIEPSANRFYLVLHKESDMGQKVITPEEKNTHRLRSETDGQGRDKINALSIEEEK